MKTEEAMKRATQAVIQAVIDNSKRLRLDRDWEAVMALAVETAAPILLAAKDAEAPLMTTPAELRAERLALQISQANELLGPWGGAAAGLVPAIWNLLADFRKALDLVEESRAESRSLAEALQRIADSFHGSQPPEGPCAHQSYVWAIEALDAYRSKQ
jgi:hypothetical protein